MGEVTIGEVLKFLGKLAIYVIYAAFVLAIIAQVVAGSFPYIQIAIAVLIGWGIISYARDHRTPDELSAKREEMMARMAAGGKNPKIAQKLAVQRVNKAPPQDPDLEPWTDHGKHIKAPNLIPAVIRYVSQEGEITTRRVDVTTVTGTIHRNKTITLVGFEGYCHLRKADRTFYFGSVEAAADPTTGEMIDHYGSFIVSKMGRPLTVRRATTAD